MQCPRDRMCFIALRCKMSWNARRDMAAKNGREGEILKRKRVIE